MRNALLIAVYPKGMLSLEAILAEIGKLVDEEPKQQPKYNGQFSHFINNIQHINLHKNDLNIKLSFSCFEN